MDDSSMTFETARDVRSAVNRAGRAGGGGRSGGASRVRDQQALRDIADPYAIDGD